MSPEYLSHVLEDYQNKLGRYQLSPNLEALTTAKFKRECLIVAEKRFLKKDEKLLNSFFNERGKHADIGQAIKMCEPDRLKPLINFLKGISKGTDEQNIELLAWLIDYEPRPYRSRLEDMYQVSGKEVEGVMSTANSSETPGRLAAQVSADTLTATTNFQTPLSPEYPFQPVTEPRQKASAAKSPAAFMSAPKKRRPLMLGIIAALVVLTGIAAYYFWMFPEDKVTPLRFPVTGEEQCMFWSIDHYQPVACNQKIENVQVYALDPDKLAHFKKITTPDTITTKAIGRVWYIKLNGHIEFYTAAGFHPVAADRRLKRLTSYILYKYGHPEAR